MGEKETGDSLGIAGYPVQPSTAGDKSVAKAARMQTTVESWLELGGRGLNWANVCAGVHSGLSESTQLAAQ